MGIDALILLDTHVWLWWLSSPDLLSKAASEQIDAAPQNGGLAVSAISVWEVAMLVKKGRLELSLPVAELIAHCERLPILRFLPISPRIALDSVTLEPFHPDPADRLIAATARAHNATLISKDQRLLAFEGISCAW